MELTPEIWKRLERAAWNVRERAYSPYSKFQVGASLLAADGTVFDGCNVECLSFGLTLCAERSALVSAVSAGQRNFLAIAIVADTDTPVAPCGACRQLLAEFGDQLVVRSINRAGEFRERTLTHLLPECSDGILNSPSRSSSQHK